MTVNEMFFKKEYNRELFVNDFLDHFLEDGIIFSPKKHEFNHKVRVIKEAWELGESPKLNLHVFEIHHASEKDPRVTLSKEAFLLMQERNLTRALMIFVSANSPNYRFSLLTIDRFLKDTSVQYTFSNPRRYSYFLGPDAKVKTPYEYLVKKGPVSSFEELVGDKEKKIKGRFSVEVVNKEFFNEIGGLFTRLVGGVRIINTRTEDFGEGILKYPSAEHRKKQEFAVRLIGRIIFLWFLKKKGGDGNPLIPDSILSTDAVKEYKERFSKNGSYYHDVLEPLFFEVLRYEQSKRKERVRDEFFRDIPFLNGGLFEPHDDDLYDVDAKGYSRKISVFNIPDSWFSDFFEILETYNFTIDENTEIDIELSVDPEMLGRIFENLLAEINPETQESARKSTGSYYTPRPIVNFMVDESLRAYLKENVPIDHDLIDFLFDVSLSEEDVNKLYTKEDREKIIVALDKIKILDPACGSGAFPMGVMQKIVDILQTIDPVNKVWKEYKFKENASYVKENIDYLRKIGIIRDNIYGVDIQPMAVEISKLRFFLSLIVDEDLESGEKNKGLKPLPNLDFKFACANTLIDIEDNETQMIGQEKEEYEKNINDLKSSMKKYFFVSDHDEKKRIQKDIESIVDAIIETKREHFEDLMKGITRGIARGENVSKKDTDRLEFLRSQKEMWESYKNIFKDEAVQFFNTALLFPDVENGFDIVIGNPPYIQLQKLKGNPLQKAYQDQGYEVYNSMGDIYTLFYEKGLNLLKEKGLLTYITSNKWMRAGYGEQLRHFFAKLNPLILIDLGPGVFESATVDTNVLVIQKSENRNKLKAVTITKESKNIPDISDFLSNNGVQLGEVSTDPWFIGNRAEMRLKEKIERIGKPLKDWDVNIYRGVLTGLNEAFIIDTPTKERLCQEDPKSEEILKPILRGRDIKRYSYNWAGLWLIQSEYDIDVPNTYPAIYKHLLRFEKKARKRQDQGANWWNLRACAYYHEFEKEKVVWAETDQSLNTVIVPKGMYLQKTCFMIIAPNPRLINGFLNSSTSQWYIRNLSSNLGQSGMSLTKDSVQEIPLPSISKSDEHIVKQIESIVDKIFEAKKQNPDAETSPWEREIDELVYRLYDLTKEEVRIIEDGI